MSAGCNPCRTVHIGADVSALCQVWCARVEAYPNLDRAGSEEPFQHLRGGPERSRRRREGDEEGIPLCVNFDAAMSDERLAENAAMLRKRVGISVGAKLARAAASSSPRRR